MATEFEQEDVIDPSDFDANPFTLIRPMNADDINKAAIAAINAVDPVSSFVEISQDRTIDNESTTEQALTLENLEQTENALTAQAHTILGDETLTLDQKKQSIASLRDTNSNVFDPRNIAASNLSAQPSLNEELNKEEQIISWSENINKWNDFVSFKQKTESHFSATHGESLGAMKFVADFATTVAPFVEAGLREDVARRMAEQGLIDEDQISEWGSPSTNQEAINSSINAGTLEERKEVIAKVLDIIDESTTAFGVTQNDYAAIELMRSFLDDEYHTDTIGAVGDAALVIDFLAVIFPPLKASKVLDLPVAKVKQLRSGILDRARANWTRGSKSSASPAEMAVNTNVDKAKNFNEALSEGGEDVATAVYGTDRSSAMIDDVMPDPIDASGTVKNKVSNVDSVVSEIEAIQRASGRTQITDAERATARELVINKIKKGSTDEVSFRSTMSQFGAVDESARFNYSAVYGATDTAGWVNVEEGVEQVLFANRNIGAVEDDLIFLARSPNLGDYVQVTKEESRLFDDILIQMNRTHEIDYKDVKYLSGEDAKLVTSSLLDRGIPSASGKISGHVKVMESTFESFISIPVLAAAEKGNLIGDVLKGRIKHFTTQLKGLTEGQVTRVDDYLRRANLEGIPFDTKELRGLGWSSKEIDTVASFRQFYDDIWELENKIEVQALRADGFGKISLGEGSEFLGKPVGRVEAGLDGAFYHPKTGEILGLPELSKLGDEFSGQILYELPSAVKSADMEFSHILIDEQNWRGLRDFDTVKAYRAGYYTVDYTNPVFIRKTIKTSTGERTVAVATAETTSAAEREVARLAAQNADSNVTYFSSANVKNKTTMKRQVDTEHGRYEMKFRGERLASANGASDEALRAPIKDPLSSMISSADKVSSRLAMIDVENTMRSRFLAAYKEVLPQGQMPDRAEDIIATKSGQGKLVADAKVMFNWMESQRRVDTNLVDRAFQESLTSFAESIGVKSMEVKGQLSSGAATLEKATRKLASHEPVMLVKTAVYKVLVALAPPRQLTLAVADSLKTLPIAPLYVSSGKLISDSQAMLATHLGIKGAAKALTLRYNRTQPQIDQMLKEFKMSGLNAGIEKQIAVQSGVKTSAKEISLSESVKVKGVVPRIASAAGAKRDGRIQAVSERATIKGVVDTAEQAGFKTAERLQNTANWLAFRQAKVTQTGRFNLTKVELDTVTAEARHFAYSMTKEAAPSYNKEALAGVLQFISVIQKGISLTLPQLFGGSKILTPFQKVKLNGFLLATYGVALTQGLDEQLMKIEDKQERETYRGGLLWAAIYNSTGASLSTKNLNPADYAGFLERVRQVANGEWAKASPALGLANRFKKNAEVAMGLFGEVGNDVFEMTTGEKAITQMRALSEFFPAASKFWNAKMIQRTKRSASQYNYTKDEQLTLAEINFKKFSWTTREEEDSFLIRRLAMDSFKEKEQDVKSLIGYLRSVAAMSGLSNDELAFKMDQSRLFWSAYRDDKVANDLAKKELKKLFTQDDKAYKSLVNMLGIMEKEEMEGIRNVAPLNESERANITDLINAFYDTTGEIK